MDSFNGEFLSIVYVKQESDSHAVPCYAEVNTTLSAFIQQLNYSVFNLFTAVTRKKCIFSLTLTNKIMLSASNFKNFD